MPATARAWNALIRTHHITSRKKVAKLKQAASAQDVFVLLRSGSSPGIMYVEGERRGTEEWVSTVQKLRYKDYQLAARPAEVEREGDGGKVQRGGLVREGLHETETVKDFAQQMYDRGVFGWWRKAMGYTGQQDRL
ncbi:hypothetical protein D0869_00751 [Hortaea werneckii]|uniref:Uncharacterized protein n=1 Tax=Hortaea werneckii TaxID=91943 RepID=A0A3M6ZB06_HORWE|nr:hypothetical protein D0869_00751 [Hortaea werneckii]RMY12201.1 hypothetical protein D0868_02700 [Hortaea werneckii]RMY21079.1 hypothetical protein D0867_03547 [Hortaea werneckii]RMY24763.1 hypothetical protein D0866_11300 [Hortaea werneckii]